MLAARHEFHKYLPMLSGRVALLCLISISFTESIFLPIQPDVLLMLMCLAQPQRTWRLAAVCTLSSVAGGILSYLIGCFLFYHIGRLIVTFYHYSKLLDELEGLYFAYGPAIFFAKLFLPMPYKVVALASGQISLGFLVFITISLTIRGYRFFLIAGLTNLFGPFIVRFIERRPISIILILIILTVSISFIFRYVLGL